MLKSFLTILLSIGLVAPAFAADAGLPAFSSQPDQQLQVRRTMQQAESRNQTLFSEEKDSDRGPIEQGYIADTLAGLEGYTLGSGDVLRAHISVRENEFSHLLPVSPQGIIHLPRFGTLDVNGLSLDEVTKRANRLVAKRLADARVTILLQQVRQIKVFVTGQVNSPGVYVIPAETRVSEVLKLAKGLAENASARRVQLTSNSQSKTLDLYRFAYDGVIEQNPRLKAGDRLHIPLITQRVAMLGQVQKPGIYELLSSESLQDAVRFAGGLTPDAALNEVTLWPGGVNNAKAPFQIFDLAQEGMKRAIAPNDVWFFAANRIPEETAMVYVYGQVARPGGVPYRVGARLSDYINAAGGPTTAADLVQVRLTRGSQSAQTPKVKKPISSTVNAHEILYNGHYEQDVEIGSNDVIFVPESFFSFNNFQDVSSVVMTGLTALSVILNLSNLGK